MQNQPCGAPQTNASKMSSFVLSCPQFVLLESSNDGNKKGRLFKQIQEGLDVAAKLWQSLKDNDCDTLLQQYGMFVDNVLVFGNHRFAISTQVWIE